MKKNSDRKPKKIQLHRETLLSLTQVEKVVGGATTATRTDISCTCTTPVSRHGLC